MKNAYDSGARWIVLCDTNGGTLPNEVREIVGQVTKVIPGQNLGITHITIQKMRWLNSRSCRVGVRQIQGTINGLGEGVEMLT